MTMKQPNKTSNVGFLIKTESIANISQNEDNVSRPHTKVQVGNGGAPISDCPPEESSASKTVSNVVKLTTFTPKLPKIKKGREERLKIEMEKSGLIHGSVERAPTWLTERTIHRDGVNRYNTHLANRAYNRPGYGRHNTSTAFLSDYGSDAGVYSSISQYDQFVEDYPYYVDSEEEEGYPQELAIIGLSTASPTRDMVSLDKPRKRTDDLTDKHTAEQVYGGYNSRLPHRLGSFEKVRDTKLYKRTRNQVKDMKKVRQWPAGLELSGKGMSDDEVVPPIKVGKDNESVDHPDDASVAESNRLPPLSENMALSPRSNTKISFSSSFFSDYGLRTNRTDSFTGYTRGRMKIRSASEAQLEKELQAKAERHIYACHVLSSVRRGSKAAHNLSSFRQAIGPHQRSIRPLSELSPPKPTHRHFNTSPDKAGHLYETVKKSSPVAFYIKTRDSSDLNRARMKASDGLPEINGRTLILGMVNK
ncbi:hypothetical protein KP79_PYT11415 [Mizuhopecten yessoensis]|uniref:Uncharacterized protein n=1 Tax=Mizuhopecten yessoensis TaxID=6573 RepID=A0A210PDV8_MIZYE|nr:hypothetical protein KP79_PYT11415 [Mizuhopecten yessoensis]